MHSYSTQFSPSTWLARNARLVWYGSLYWITCQRSYFFSGCVSICRPIFRFYRYVRKVLEEICFIKPCYFHNEKKETNHKIKYWEHQKCQELGASVCVFVSAGENTRTPVQCKRHTKRSTNQRIFHSTTITWRLSTTMDVCVCASVRECILPICCCMTASGIEMKWML